MTNSETTNSERQHDRVVQDRAVPARACLSFLVASEWTGPSGLADEQDRGTLGVDERVECRHLSLLKKGVDAVVEPYSAVLCSRNSVANPDGCMALDSEASDFNAQRVGLLTGCDVSTMRERLWEAWWTSISSDVIILFLLGLWQSRVHVVGRSVVWHSPPGCQSLFPALVRRRFCTLADGTLPDSNIFTVGAKCICPAGSHRQGALWPAVLVFSLFARIYWF